VTAAKICEALVVVRGIGEGKPKKAAGEKRRKYQQRS